MKIFVNNRLWKEDDVKNQTSQLFGYFIYIIENFSHNSDDILTNNENASSDGFSKSIQEIL